MSDLGRAEALTILREYGASIRGAWGDIDGRSVRDDLDDIADWAEAGEVPQDARERLGICESGKGHWGEFCDEACGGSDG